VDLMNHTGKSLSANIQIFSECLNMYITLDIYSNVVSNGYTHHSACRENHINTWSLKMEMPEIIFSNTVNFQTNLAKMFHNVFFALNHCCSKG